MKIPLRSRRAAMVVGATLALALALGFGGFVAVGAAPAGAATGVGTPTVTDNVQGTVTTTDDIVTCLPYTDSINGVEAVVFPDGCLTLYYGDNVTVTWSGTGVTLEMRLQGTDGNFIVSTPANYWAANTALAETTKGPGCKASFQSDVNLVVSNCASTAISASGSGDTNPYSVLAFQADGDLVIYNQVCIPATSTSCLVGYQALWSTGTS